MSIEGKIALVTGASRGIGRAIASRLGSCGAVVIGSATSAAGAESISEYLASSGIEGHGICLDVSSSDSVKEVFAAMKSNQGMPDILINNAGITKDGLFMRMKDDQWNDVINTNLTSLYRVTKVAVKHMLRQRFGRIVNIGSVVGHVGNPGQANYCAAKAGMIGFTKSIALEFASYGITANVVSPGFIDTQMTQEMEDKAKEQVVSSIPMQKVGSVSDIAHAVSFLSSMESGYITGQTLHVNGGLLMA